jgi:hypothetical protein
MKILPGTDRLVTKRYRSLSLRYKAVNDPNLSPGFGDQGRVFFSFNVS